MKKSPAATKTIDAYISDFSQDIQGMLQAIRATINNAAPNATETINYGIPTFQLEGNLVHFAAYKNHIGFYPGASGVAAFREDLAAYKTAKGAIHLSPTLPLPLNLITKIVQYRVRQNLEIAALKEMSKKAKTKNRR